MTNAVTPAPAPALLAHSESRWPAPVRFILRLAKLRLAAFGLVVIAVVVFAAITAPLIAPYARDEPDVRNILSNPTAKHPLGTDYIGRDVLTRIIYGARISLLVGVIAVGIAASVGVPLGLIAGYGGGLVDALIMRVMDALIAFPGLILALALVAVLGAAIQNVMIAIGVVIIPTYARIVRAETLAIRETDYVLAAQMIGANTRRILVRHIFPNALPPILVVATLGLAGAVLAEAGLSFLGLGVKPPTPTWGSMLLDGFPVMRQVPIVAVAPGVAIFLFVLAVNFVGDSLRDVLDPRLRGALRT
ncbi:MAG: ABC transporter permease [Chloroflexi bacterium]|nr:ABC transporter permease [Chloroflexota bacterium]